MLKKRLLQAYFTLTVFLLFFFGIRYLANSVPEFNSAILITGMLVVCMLLASTAGMALMRMVDDYDKKHDPAPESEPKSTKPGKPQKEK